MLTRRDTFKVTAGAAVAALLPSMAFAAEDGPIFSEPKIDYNPAWKQTTIEQFWQIPEYDSHFMTILSFGPMLPALEKAWPAHKPFPKILNTEEMIGYTRKCASLNARDFRYYKKTMGIWPGSEGPHKEFSTLTWRRRNGTWTAHWGSGRGGFYGRDVSREEWIEALKEAPIYDMNNFKSYWAWNGRMMDRFDVKTRRPRWDELTVEEEIQYLSHLVG